MSPLYERTNSWIDQLQAGQRPGNPPPATPEDLTLILAAGELAGARPGADEPDPAFLAGLRARLFGDQPDQPGMGQVAEAGVKPAPPAPLPAGWRPTPSVPPRPPVRRLLTPEPPAASGVGRDKGTVAAGVLAGRGLDRRSFLGALFAAVAGLFAGLGLDRLAGRDNAGAAESNLPPGRLPDGQGRWFVVANLSELQIGQGIPVTMGKVQGILIRTGTREVNVLSGVCTHLGCPVGWNGTDRKIYCGCHGSSFDASGKPLTGPALYQQPIRNLPVFSWKIDNDTIYVLA